MIIVNNLDRISSNYKGSSDFTERYDEIWFICLKSIAKHLGCKLIKVRNKKNKNLFDIYIGNYSKK